MTHTMRPGGPDHIGPGPLQGRPASDYYRADVVDIVTYHCKPTLQRLGLTEAAMFPFVMDLLGDLAYVLPIALDRRTSDRKAEADGRTTPSERAGVPFKVTDRGFRHYEPIPTGYGHLVSVRESGAASEPCIWIDIERGADRLAAHMRGQEAERLIQTLRFALDAHYQRRERDG